LLVGWMESSGAAFEARLVELEKLRGRPDSFHPKAWRIADSSGGIVVVGSSNLSRAALVSGVEWNLVGETSGSGALDRELIAAFDDLWQQATPLSADVVERYAARAAPAAEMRRAWDRGAERADDAAAAMGEIRPRPWQTSALASLARIRGQGYSKALVAVATGLGKTWLAAFDVVAIAKTLGRLPRVLVIAHRAEILAQAEATLRSALAAACRSFLENHPALRVDLKGAAFSRVPGDSALDMENFAAWWLEWPLSRWMADQAGERRFTRRNDGFVEDFTCPPELGVVGFSKLTAVTKWYTI
jgi:hypothetical protein